MNDEWLDTVYSDYHNWKGWKRSRNAEGEVARALRELRAAKRPAPARLLEVGFGDGALLRRAQALGYECAGLERSDAQVPELQREGIDARAGSPEQFAGRTFDIIAAFDVFEHIPVPELIRNLRDFSALLAPEGRLIARFPNMASPFGLANQYGDVTHVTPLSASSFAQLARLNSLEVVYVGNGATVLRSSNFFRMLAKPLTILVRKTIETLLGFAYYGAIVPLGPSIVVVLQKSDNLGDV